MGEGQGHRPGKGIHINSLLKHDWSMVGTLTGQLDFCARVKVSREVTK